jgi:hypothetical protein
LDDPQETVAVDRALVLDPLVVADDGGDLRGIPGRDLPGQASNGGWIVAVMKSSRPRTL